MTERVIADSPADGWSIGLVMSDTQPANVMPPAGTVLTGVHIIGPTAFAFITLDVTINGSAFQAKVNNGVNQTFPVNPPMVIQTGLGLKGSGWKIAGVTDSLTVLDPAGNVLAKTSA